jgi:hypothetical protein
MHVAAEDEAASLEDGLDKLARTQPRPPLLFPFAFSSPTSSSLREGCLDDITYCLIFLPFQSSILPSRSSPNDHVRRRSGSSTRARVFGLDLFRGRLPSLHRRSRRERTNKVLPSYSRSDTAGAAARNTHSAQASSRSDKHSYSLRST